MLEKGHSELVKRMFCVPRKSLVQSLVFAVTKQIMGNTIHPVVFISCLVPQFAVSSIPVQLEEFLQSILELQHKTFGLCTYA